mgnify:CR=1 FL=1
MIRLHLTDLFIYGQGMQSQMKQLSDLNECVAAKEDLPLVNPRVKKGSTSVHFLGKSRGSLFTVYMGL